MRTSRIKSVGDGETDIVFVPCWMSHLDRYHREPRFVRFIERMSLFGRVILFDKRGTGLSDPVFVLGVPDARGSHGRSDGGAERGWLEQGGPVWNGDRGQVVGVCTQLRIRSGWRVLILMETSARGAWACDYPFAPTWDVWEQRFEHLNAELGWSGLDRGLRSQPEDGSPVRDLVGGVPAERGWPGRGGRDGAARCGERYPVGAAFDRGACTLVLHRRGDQVVKVEEGRYMAEHIPGAQLDRAGWRGPSAIRRRPGGAVPRNRPVPDKPTRIDSS